MNDSLSLWPTVRSFPPPSSTRKIIKMGSKRLQNSSQTSVCVHRETQQQIRALRRRWEWVKCGKSNKSSHHTSQHNARHQGAASRRGGAPTVLRRIWRSQRPRWPLAEVKRNRRWNVLPSVQTNSLLSVITVKTEEINRKAKDGLRRMSVSERLILRSLNMCLPWNLKYISLLIKCIEWMNNHRI